MPGGDDYDYEQGDSWTPYLGSKVFSKFLRV